MLPWLPLPLMYLVQWPGLTLEGPLPHQGVPQSEPCLSEKHSWRLLLLLLLWSLALRLGSLASSAQLTYPPAPHSLEGDGTTLQDHSASASH